MKHKSTAVILAGGKSSRMGFDKQYLRFSMESLTLFLASRLRTRFDDILVITNTPELYQGEDLRVERDVYPGLGPMAGIHAGLTYSDSPAIFVMACDMPYLDYPYMDYQLSRSQGGNYDACVTAIPGSSYVQTFHSFYFRSCLPQLERDLQAGLSSLQRFLAEINTLVISESEARSYMTITKLFSSINTREEYQRFLAEENEDIF